MKHFALLIGSAIALATSACSVGAGSFTLYRDSLLTTGARVHIATFDAEHGEAYNSKNCNLAASLFSAQAGVQTKFWCEKGDFRK